MRRGQSTIELALLLPVVVGLLAVILQGGLIISDQVNLEQFATEGAQYALANISTATPGSITDHINGQMCGQNANQTNASYPSTATNTTKFCKQEPGGVPGLSVQVTPGAVTAAVQPHPTSQVMASCTGNIQKWGLSFSPLTATVSAGGSTPTATYAISFTSGSPSGSGQWPVVGLSGGPYPSGLNATPLFTPATIAPAGGPSSVNYGPTSSLTITATTATPAGTYVIPITGQDQGCNSPTGGYTSVTLVVQPVSVATTPSPTPSIPPTPSPTVTTITSVLPSTICEGLATAMTILGANFVPGMTVSLGGIPATSVVVVNSGQINATISSAQPGVYSLEVFASGSANPQAVLVDAVTTTATCLSTPAPAFSANPCNTSVGGFTGGANQSVESTITITWREPLVIPWLAVAGTPYVTLTATQVVMCQPSP